MPTVEVRIQPQGDTLLFFHLEAVKMSIDKQTLESMLWTLAGFRVGEYKEVGWPSMSMTGKIIQLSKTGIFSPGTRHQTQDFSVPEYIEQMHQAIIQLPLPYQHVIKAEYERKGKQKEKAKHLKLSVNNYRATLCRAKQKLMQII